MGFKYSARSLARLEGVHPALKRVFLRAIGESSVDFTIIEGVRPDARQLELYAQGRTKPGKIVTWTLASKHKRQKDGYGHAVDAAPITAAGVIDWENLAAFDLMAKAILAAAKAEGVNVRWGADWDQDGKFREKGETDSPHFELA